MSILGLDYGSRTVGVAISEGSIASPLETIWRADENNLKATVSRLKQIVEENGVTLMVLGLPLNMDDSVGERAQRALSFQKRLQRDIPHVPVIMQDERLSTWEAEQPMIEAGVHGRRKRKEKLDQMAACVILQDYLAKTHASSENA